MGGRSETFSFFLGNSFLSIVNPFYILPVAKFGDRAGKKKEKAESYCFLNELANDKCFLSIIIIQIACGDKLNPYPKRNFTIIQARDFVLIIFFSGKKMNVL